jgi:hypothetical protein
MDTTCGLQEIESRVIARAFAAVLDESSDDGDLSAKAPRGRVQMPLLVAGRGWARVFGAEGLNQMPSLFANQSSSSSGPVKSSRSTASCSRRGRGREAMRSLAAGPISWKRRWS